jgi:thiol-disulfide isomerase/thioredoxin
MLLSFLLAFTVVPALAGPWRAVLDLAGGPLRFALTVEQKGGTWQGKLCNGTQCQALSAVRLAGDSVVFDISVYAATIAAVVRGDSLLGEYHNVGRRGPRTIPFRAARGRWPIEKGPVGLTGRWDAQFLTDFDASPRVIELRNGQAGLEGTIISNTGDYGLFWGHAQADSFSISHFDGSYVYMLTGQLKGDTLRGVFHAGLRTQTRFVAIRSTGAPHLKSPSEITTADTAPFRFSFPDLEGRQVTEADPRLKDKVVVIDVFGTWCPTCHDAAPALVQLYKDYHARGLEIVGLAYEVSGDSATDNQQVRLYRDTYHIPFILLRAGTNDTEAAAATLPQLTNFTAFPTTIFLDRTGRVRRIHAGFYGPALPEQHAKLVKEMQAEVEGLLQER